MPSDTELNTTVNFYDNMADTGGSPPGQRTTSTWAILKPMASNNTAIPMRSRATSGVHESGCFTQAELIGKRSVVIEVNLDYATPPLSTINDFGTGRFEIGGTDATNINAQSTGQTGDGGLIMDLPASYWGAFGAAIGGSGYSGENLFFETFGNENGTSNLGITVVGASSSTNLLQGSSGPIHLDIAASGLAALLGNDAYYGAVGNNTITGGTGGRQHFVRVVTTPSTSTMRHRSR